jgi:hypothetical protein
MSKIHLNGITILSSKFSKKLYFENGKAAAPSFAPPIEILIKASKVLESTKTKKGYHF